MEPYETENIRRRVEDILKRVYGSFVGDIRITNISQKGNGVTVKGEFSEHLFEEPKKSFSMELDKRGRLLDLSISEK